MLYRSIGVLFAVSASVPIIRVFSVSTSFLPVRFVFDIKTLFPCDLFVLLFLLYKLEILCCILVMVVILQHHSQSLIFDVLHIGGQFADKLVYSDFVDP